MLAPPRRTSRHLLVAPEAPCLTTLSVSPTPAHDPTKVMTWTRTDNEFNTVRLDAQHGQLRSLRRDKRQRKKLHFGARALLSNRARPAWIPTRGDLLQRHAHPPARDEALVDSTKKPYFLGPVRARGSPRLSGDDAASRPPHRRTLSEGHKPRTASWYSRGSLRHRTSARGSAAGACRRHPRKDMNVPVCHNLVVTQCQMT